MAGSFTDLLSRYWGGDTGGMLPEPGSGPSAFLPEARGSAGFLPESGGTAWLGGLLDTVNAGKSAAYQAAQALVEQAQKKQQQTQTHANQPGTVNPNNPTGAPMAGAPGAAQIPAQYQPHVSAAATKYNIDPHLIAAVARQESNWNPAATSRAGAQGLMQLMPDTARGLGVTDPWDVGQNIDAGARYLAYFVHQYPNDLPRALAAYNAGPGAVEQYGGVPPFPETQAYVQNVQNYYNQYRASPAAPMGVAAPVSSGAVGGNPWQIAFDFNQPYSTPLPGGTSVHRGVDLVIPGAPNNGRGSTYTAFVPGTVVALTHDPAGGNGIIVQGADGLYQRYFHNDRVLVREGQQVDQNTPLGVVGASGTEGFPHLHFEVSRNLNGDRPTQLIDPRPYLQGAVQ